MEHLQFPSKTPVTNRPYDGLRRYDAVEFVVDSLLA